MQKQAQCDNNDELSTMQFFSTDLLKYLAPEGHEETHPKFILYFDDYGKGDIKLYVRAFSDSDDGLCSRRIVERSTKNDDNSKMIESTIMEICGIMETYSKLKDWEYQFKVDIGNTIVLPEVEQLAAIFNINIVNNLEKIKQWLDKQQIESSDEND